MCLDRRSTSRGVVGDVPGEQMSFVSKKLSELPEVRAVFDLAVTGMTIEKCIKLAYDRFYRLFRDAIQSLVS